MSERLFNALYAILLICMVGFFASLFGLYVIIAVIEAAQRMGLVNG